MAVGLRAVAWEKQSEVIPADEAEAITARIREEAASLLESEAVDVIIGYAQSWDGQRVTPCFLTKPSEVGRLIYNQGCTHNLAKYLVGADGYLTSPIKTATSKPRVGLVANPGTLRSIVGLIQEHQIVREDVVLLGIVDGGPLGIEPDVTVGQIAPDTEREAEIEAQIARLQEMTVIERWQWWEAQFAKCIRCYACRQVCPSCYCEQCIADENQPQWIERSSTTMNNRVWHTIRAFHMVGRCVGCGECERVCPVGIPLSLLTTKMRHEVRGAFDYVAGADASAPSALFSFRVDDPDDFVR